MKVFIEEQKFNQPFIIIGLSMVLIVVGISTYNGWEQIPAGNIGEKIGILSSFIITALIVLLFVFLKLKTRIDEKGIYYQFHPFQFSLKLIPWFSISKCYIREYNAITEYGGWGMKFSFFGKKGKSYTTKGNIGLQIELKTGKKILIGTQNKEAMQQTLDTYKSKIS
jgi:hypothetical protein